MIFLNLKNCSVGEIFLIPYKDIVFVCRKYRQKLKPNIYINTKFLRVGESIRGNIVIVSYKNNSFISLTKEQATKYIDFLKNASFNYNNTIKNNYYFIHKNTKFFKNLEKELIPSDIKKTYTRNIQNQEHETLQMLLSIQTIILKFIKNYKN